MLKHNQVKYISERLDVVFKDKRGAIQEKADAQKIALYDAAFKKKDYVVEKKLNYYRREYTFDVTFPKLVKQIGAVDKETHTLINTLQGQMQKVKDEAILGDVEGALQALGDFEAIKV